MTFRVPNTAQDKFMKIAEHYIKDTKMRQYDFFSLLLLECLEHTVEYMGYGDVKEAAQAEESTDYLFPYLFKQVETDEDQLNQHFCGHFEKYSPN
jgi:hypothetical protein